jgi:transcriptional regulator with XRE-family HTH domain
MPIYNIDKCVYYFHTQIKEVDKVIMFDKEKFKELLIKATGERTQEEFAELCGVNRTYISKYLNMRLDNPPSPNILKRIALNAWNDVTYEQLMDAAGHIDKSELGFAYVEVGKYIAIIRQKKELSQETLAELSGVSVDTISDIESGKLEEPSTDILKALAPPLDIDYHELISMIGKFEFDSRNKCSYIVYGNEKVKVEFVNETGNQYNANEDDLPEAAKEELKNFVDYLKTKYKTKDNK